ncbi:sensor histidine kinase [Deinococcus yavapaiensis]|uniref:histidine kinase n=1 Tax=Deinococcus yavapaiensis KR-236 TaxID=694435 RepID=A0A318SHY3_9DEIO|nr:ATP-binding protein [Deinococcus yavapaiensis]PYE50982.1 phospho-acceptor domain-containing protein [Deinococcus yavapaiensis KR-236]
MATSPSHPFGASEEVHRLAALEAFVEFTIAIGSHSDLLEVVQQAIRVLQARFPNGSAVYFERDEDLWKARVCSVDMSEELAAVLQAGLPSTTPSIAQALQECDLAFTNAWNPEREQVPNTEEYGTVVSAPLIRRGHPEGIFSFGLRDVQTWTEADASLVRAVMLGLNLAYERVDTTEQLRRQAAQLEARTNALEAFAELSREFALEMDRVSLVRRAQEIVLGLLPQGYAVYYELDGAVWRLRSQTGELGNADLQAFVNAGIPREAPSLMGPYTSGHPEYQDEYAKGADTPAEAVRHVNTIAVLPVHVHGTCVGLFCVGLFERRPWTSIDKTILETATYKLGIALERSLGLLQLAEERQKLAVANEELEAFAYSVSHDLRAPVRHITSFSHMLRKTVGEHLASKTSQYLTMIDDAAERMNVLIDAMLDLSRLARLPLRLGPVDLEALVNAVQIELASDVLERQVMWQVSPLPLVMGDADLLRQVMWNLLSNAVKYTRGEDVTVIEVWAENREEEWVVFVRDNGAGFDAKYVDKLFGVFQRLHRANEFEGVGVGLANVRRIVQRHGGRVAASGSVGEGATFSFTLPKQP